MLAKNNDLRLTNHNWVIVTKIRLAKIQLLQYHEKNKKDSLSF